MWQGKWMLHNLCNWSSEIVSHCSSWLLVAEQIKSPVAAAALSSKAKPNSSSSRLSHQQQLAPVTQHVGQQQQQQHYQELQQHAALQVELFLRALSWHPLLLGSSSQKARHLTRSCSYHASHRYGQ
jgi:hypothetical protein